MAPKKENEGPINWQEIQDISGEDLPKWGLSHSDIKILPLFHLWSIGFQKLGKWTGSLVHNKQI